MKADDKRNNFCAPHVRANKAKKAARLDALRSLQPKDRPFSQSLSRFDSLPDDFAVRFDVVTQRYGICQETLRKRCAAGTFPPPIYVARAKAWLVGDLRAFERKAQAEAKP